MRRHLRNTVTPIPDHPNAGPWKVAFEKFLSAPLQPERFGGVTLSSLKHYLQCAKDSASLILHYSDLVSDARGTVKTLQQHLGLDLTDLELRQILDRTRRNTMAENADKYFPTPRTECSKTMHSSLDQQMTRRSTFARQILLFWNHALEHTSPPETATGFCEEHEFLGTGPKLPSSFGLGFCGRNPLCRRSLRLQNF